MSQDVLLCLISPTILLKLFHLQICQNAFDTSHVKQSGSSTHVIIFCVFSWIRGGVAEQEDGFLPAKSQSPSLRFVAKDSPVCHLASIDLACFVLLNGMWMHGRRMSKVISFLFTSNDRVSTTSMTSEYD
jgi:hypothetical protein